AAPSAVAPTAEQAAAALAHPPAMAIPGAVAAVGPARGGGHRRSARGRHAHLDRLGHRHHFTVFLLPLLGDRLVAAHRPRALLDNRDALDDLDLALVRLGHALDHFAGPFLLHGDALDDLNRLLHGLGDALLDLPSPLLLDGDALDHLDLLLHSLG